MASPYPRPEHGIVRDPNRALPRRATSLVQDRPLPADLTYPDLPAPTRAPDSFAPGYTVTTHIVPASFPRYSLLQPLKYAETAKLIPNDPPSNNTEKFAWAKKTSKAIIGKRALLQALEANDAPMANVDSSEQEKAVMWTVVNRYALKDSHDGKGLTVIVTHPVGLHKETWEPCFRKMIEETQHLGASSRIDEIWSLDSTSHGDSALLNAKYLTDHYDWLDDVRDILNFVENYLPEHSGASDLPIHLPHVSQNLAAGRATHGFAPEGRHLVGLGHSGGGTNLANATGLRPNMFRSVTLIEIPITANSRLLKEYTSFTIPASIGALLRRKHWPSREEARKSLQKNPFFISWSPEVLDTYLQFGIIDAPQGGVRLKMDPFHEAVYFTESIVSIETSYLVEEIDKRVALRWILSMKPTVGNFATMQDIVWTRPENSANVRVPEGLHLLVQEVPNVVAAHIVNGWDSIRKATTISSSEDRARL